MRGMVLLLLLSIGGAYAAPPADLTTQEREVLHVAQKKVLWAQLNAERAAKAAEEARKAAEEAQRKLNEEFAAYQALEAATAKKHGQPEGTRLGSELEWTKPEVKK